MSFYSYKNSNSQTCPGMVNGNILSGLNQRVCVQVKNIYDSCMQQEQLDDERVVIENIVPVLPGSDCLGTGNRPCSCDCEGNRCNCDCPPSGIGITHQEAVENAENAPGPLPRPYGAWTFESCRSSTTAGRISNLSIERLGDRPQFARVRCTVDVPLDVLFLDQRCQEWMGQTVVKVDKDILLCIPDDSIIPFTLESLVSAICVSGSYIGNCAFDITVCVTVVLKVLAEVDILIPTYGFCQVPPCEEFAEQICDELHAYLSRHTARRPSAGLSIPLENFYINSSSYLLTLYKLYAIIVSEIERGETKMKGTEKQIKWAEDIKANAINTCTANIERLSVQPLDAMRVEVFKVIRKTLIDGFEQIDDAAVIINKRAHFDPMAIIRMADRTSELINSGHMTLEQFAAR